MAVESWCWFFALCLAPCTLCLWRDFKCHMFFDKHPGFFFIHCYFLKVRIIVFKISNMQKILI